MEDVATLAFAEETEKAKNDACFSAFVKGLKDTELRIKLREGRLRTFAAVVEEACRVEGIRKAELKRTRPTRHEQEALDIYRIDDQKQQDT